MNTSTSILASLHVYAKADQHNGLLQWLDHMSTCDAYKPDQQQFFKDELHKGCDMHAKQALPVPYNLLQSDILSIIIKL